MSGKLKIHVDQEKCQGHARCKSLAPELFELDEFGNAHEIGDGSVPKGLEDKAWLGQANCPEIGIDVTAEWSCPRNNSIRAIFDHSWQNRGKGPMTESVSLLPDHPPVTRLVHGSA